jgi:hypothetical protein
MRTDPERPKRALRPLGRVRPARPFARSGLALGRSSAARYSSFEWLPSQFGMLALLRHVHQAHTLPPAPTSTIWGVNSDPAWLPSQ